MKNFTEPWCMKRTPNRVFIFQGFAFGQVGPALPDLQQITGVDLSTASWLFTASSFGYMFGCFLSGVMEKRFNPRFILCGCLLGSAVFTTITPWFKLFNLMVTARVGNGLFFGGIDTGIFEPRCENTYLPICESNEYVSQSVHPRAVPPKCSMLAWNNLASLAIQNTPSEYFDQTVRIFVRRCVVFI